MTEKDFYGYVTLNLNYETIAMPITNAEKQARFRKKQELKNFKDQVFKKLQLNLPFRSRRETPDEIHSLLEEAARLPSGWNEEDLDRAFRCIRQLYFEFESPREDLKMDLVDVKVHLEEFASTPDPRKFFSDTEESISKTRVLASHLISALELSTLSNSERAAAVMEAIRHVGRAATISGDMVKSDAMMVCQASLQSHYDRPDWFLDSLAKWLANRLDEELVHELGKRLANFQQKDML
ncbi:MAG: hypothetical protein P1P89_13740 [Desulfobacterales bacterium]|nr:hypothetical protein [Desulfobacterales bacterium]